MPSLRASGRLRASGGLRASGAFRNRRASRVSRSASRPAGLGARRKSRASLRFTRLRSSDNDDSLQDIVSGQWDDDGCADASADTDTATGNNSSKNNLPKSSSRYDSADDAQDATRIFKKNTVAVPKCSVEAASITFNAAVRQKFKQQIPKLEQTTLGKKWSVDIIAFMHNAIQLECCDLLDILTSMLLGAEGGKKTSIHELRAFFAWFSTFETFLIAALKSEEDVLYPWLEQWGRIEGALSTGSRISVKGSIVRNIRDTSACSALLGFHHLPAGGILNQGAQGNLAVGFVRKISQDDIPTDVDTRTTTKTNNNNNNNTNNTNNNNNSTNNNNNNSSNINCRKVLNAVITQVIKFMQELIGYFKEQEDALPKIIESLYEKEDVKSSNIIKRMIKATWKISSYGKRDELIPILVRGLGSNNINNKTYARNWVQTNLRHIDRLSLPIWRRKYVSGRGAVVEKFRSRKKKYEQLLELHGRMLITYDDDNNTSNNIDKDDGGKKDGDNNNSNTSRSESNSRRNNNSNRKKKEEEKEVESSPKVDNAENDSENSTALLLRKRTKSRVGKPESSGRLRGFASRKKRF